MASKSVNSENEIGKQLNKNPGRKVSWMQERYDTSSIGLKFTLLKRNASLCFDFRRQNINTSKHQTDLIFYQKTENKNKNRISGKAFLQAQNGWNIFIFGLLYAGDQFDLK